MCVLSAVEAKIRPQSVWRLLTSNIGRQTRNQGIKRFDKCHDLCTEVSIKVTSFFLARIFKFRTAFKWKKGVILMRRIFGMTPFFAVKDRAYSQITASKKDVTPQTLPP
jgi:hypothetical protein